MSDKPLQDALRDLVNALDSVGQEGWVPAIDGALTTARASLEAVEDAEPSGPCPECGVTAWEDQPEDPDQSRWRCNGTGCGYRPSPPDPQPAADYKGALWDLRDAVHAYLLACGTSGDPAVIGELRVDLTKADRTALRFLGGKGEQDG